MTTLTDFLLARIAEDEQRAREDGTDAMVGWRWKHYPEEAYNVIQALTLQTSKRVLAECEAKRQIVALATRPEHQSFSSPWVSALLALAAPYADHPDYREEWKP